VQKEIIKGASNCLGEESTSYN